MQENVVKKKDSIQAFRALLCLSVIFLHVLQRLGAFNFILLLHVSITPFFVMSGFLLMLKSSRDDDSCSFLICWNSMKKRISRLYPLHALAAVFVFSLLALRFIHGGSLKENIADLSIKLFLNIFLIQAWFPKYAVSLNAPAWYLSAAAFLYFLFPLVKRVTYKFDKGGGRLLLVLLIFAFRFFWAALSMVIAEALDCESYSFALCYYFPIFRLSDFWLGCLAGLFYKERKDMLSLSNAKVCFLQILATVAGILFFSIKTGAFPFWAKAFFLSDIVRVVLSVVWVYFFMEGSGFARLLTLAPLVALGNLSGLCYMLHWPVAVEFLGAVADFLKIDFSKWNMFQLYIAAIAEFLLTVLASIVWSFLSKRRQPFRES